MNNTYITDTIKQGSIILEKFPLLTRMWKKINGKSIYKTVTLHLSNSYVLVSTPNFIVFEPKKIYNNKEINKALLLKSDDQTTISTESDLIAIINIIRPNTLDSTLDINQLYNNKYYTRTQVDAVKLW